MLWNFLLDFGYCCRYTNLHRFREEEPLANPNSRTRDRPVLMPADARLHFETCPDAQNVKPGGPAPNPTDPNTERDRP